MAVTLSNEHDEVLGHAAFFDYPNIAGVDSAAWEEWLNTYYDAGHCKSLNTLFMHYFVAKPEYSHGCAREIIRTMFNAVPELHSCFIVVPVGVSPGERTLIIYLNTIKPRVEAMASTRVGSALSGGAAYTQVFRCIVQY